MINKQELIRELTKFNIWDEGVRVRHLKRGTEYYVYDIVSNATNDRDGEVLVTYSGEDGKTWAREINEFCDGRFEIIK